jgi:hypothetical protein
MSKIITKNQLSLVIESTLKEADYMMENKEEIKLTKQHMDKLHKEGHCMCDDKCIVYPEAVYGDSKKSFEVVKLVAEKDGDCVVISKEQMDMLHKDGKCDCDNNVTLSYDDEMKEGDYMEDGMNENKEMCSECGTGMMVEGMCNECGYSMNMDEAGVDEGNEFTGELNKAREEGKATFTVDGKTYKVEPADKEEKDKVEESVSELTESLSKTTKKELMKEDMDFFNKMINYNKK